MRIVDACVISAVYDDDGGGRWSLMFRITGAEYQYYRDADDLPVSDETVELESVRAELAEALDRIVELEADLTASRRATILTKLLAMSAGW